MSWLKKARGALFEESSEIATKQQPVAAVPAPIAVESPVSALTVSGDSDLYKGIAAKTTFEKTSVGDVITKLLDTLKSAPLDASTKLKVAIEQAKLIHGLTDTIILAAFDEMNSKLVTEQEFFAQTNAKFVSEGVTARGERVAEIEARLKELRTEIADLETELVKTMTEMKSAQMQSDSVSAQFSAACARRSTEITQERDRVAALLKG